MTLKVGICFHDLETNRKRWESFIRNLQNHLKEDVKLEEFKDFEDELVKLHENYDLYYALPSIALELIKRGYKPFAKFKNSQEEIVAVSIKGIDFEKIDLLRISTPKLASFMVPVIKLGFGIDRIKFVYTKTLKETFEKLEKGEADLAIITGDFLKKLKIKGIKVYKDLSFTVEHFLLSKEPERFREILAKIERIEEANAEDLKVYENIFKVLERLLGYVQAVNISEALITSPFIGVAIYKDRILFTNRTFQKMVGYTEEELKSMSPTDLIKGGADIEKVKLAIQRRIKGEQFSGLYELKLGRKDGSYVYTLTFTRTILYRGEYAGLGIFIDITHQKKLQRLYSLVREINQITISSTLEEEVYEKLCKALVEKFKLRFVWIGFPDRKKKEIVPVYKCGYEDGYLSGIKISLDPSEAESRGPTATAVREHKIIVNPDTRTNPLMKPWKEEMLKRKYLSSCAIPIVIGRKVEAVINLYAEEPNFFEENTIEALYEIKKDIEFAIKRLREIRDRIIISRAIEKSDEWILVTDEKGRIIYVNDAVCKISGYSKKELIGKKPGIFRSGYHNREFYKRLWETILSGKEFYALFVNRKKDGELFYLQARIIPVKFPTGEVRFLEIGKDVTRELILGREVERIRFSDPVTGLYNLTGFSFKVEETIKEVNHSALILIDIIDLALINKNFGFQTGDRLLKAVGDRLKKTFREDDIIGRLGGDEFGIFLSRLSRKDDVLIVEKKLEEAFKEPFALNGKEINVKVNGGIAIYPDDGKDFVTLYEKASLALHEAKKEGINEIKFYSSTLESKAKNFVRTESLLERAIKKNLFVLFFQPYFYTDTLAVAGIEALVRIIDEEGKVHPPSEFIDYLERSHYIRDFSYWLLNEVEKAIERWNLPISFNVSGRSFRDREFMNRLIKFAKAFSAFITVEITENVLIYNFEEAKKILEELKFYGGGVKLAIDDFGTGYSSFLYLTEFPVDIVKIDVTFTRSLLTDSKKSAVVYSTIKLAQSLNIKTVAEGVETEEQYDLLKKLKCDMVQGFLFAKPMHPDDLDRFLKEWNLKKRGKG